MKMTKNKTFFCQYSPRSFQLMYGQTNWSMGQWRDGWIFFVIAVCNDLRFGLVENFWERHVTSFVTTTAFSNVCDEFCIAIQGSIKISLFLLGIYSINLNLDMDKMYLWDRQSKKIMERPTKAYSRVVKKVVQATFHQFPLL